MNTRSTKLRNAKQRAFQETNASFIISTVPNGGHCPPSAGDLKIEDCAISLAGVTLCIGSITTPV